MDFLRTTAVIMVLGRHAVPSSWLGQVGWAGVDLFFVLSGFLISGLLFDAWLKHGTVDVRRFLVRRGLKLYPGFYVLILSRPIAELIVHHTASDVWPRRFLVEAFFLQSYFPGMYNHTWSLGVEEHFYLILPLVLFAAYRFSSSPNPFVQMPWLFVFVFTACLAARVIVGWNLSDWRYNYVDLYPTHLRLDGLMCGVVLSYYRRFKPQTFRSIQNSRLLGWIVVITAVTGLFVFPLEDPWMHTVGLSVLALAFGFLVAQAVDYTPGRHTKLFVESAARLGFYSYSVYLWHMWVLKGMQASSLFRHQDVLFFAVYVMLAFVVGITAAMVIERPVLLFRDRYFPSEGVAVRANAIGNKAVLSRSS